MKKQAKITPTPSPTQSTQKDVFNELPEDMWENIFSRLTMKEAAKTCILSRRWRNLWTVFFSHLDFDVSKTMDLILDGVKEHDVEAPKYRDWVDQVLASHEGSSLEQLRIAFDLDMSYAPDVDKWVDFAIRKKVRRLEVDLNRIAGCNSCSYSVYKFPSSLLGFSVDFPSFHRLTALSLKSVSITEEDLAYFLSTCLFLEQLLVENSSSLKNFTVSGQSLKLKHLEIGYCLKLRKVNVSAASLVSFKYAGPMIQICFDEVPELTLVSFGNPFAERLITKSPSTSYVSQLVKLELDLKILGPGRSLSFPSTFPELSNLKHLELKFVAVASKSIIYLCSIMGASPRLSWLTLKYDIDWTEAGKTATYRGMHPIRLAMYEKEYEERAMQYNRNRLSSLKAIEFVGWAGVKADVQLANYLIDNSGSLEEIVFDRRVPCRTRRSWSEELLPIPKNRDTALLSVEQLQNRLPPTTLLIMF